MSRTSAQLKAAAKLFKKPAGPLEPVDLSNNPAAPAWMTRCFMNNRYVVMINDNTTMTNGVTAIKAMIQRHDDQPIPYHWSQLQAIKNEIFGPETTAIEFYPAESQLMNDANIYWLWVLPEQALPKALALDSGADHD